MSKVGAKTSGSDKKQKKKIGKRTKGATPSQSTYIAKIARKYVGEHEKDEKGVVVKKNPNKVTFSKSAISEVEMLMNNAVGIILNNTDKVMDYSGQKTMGKSAVEVATTLALAGLLRDKALRSGSKAVANYNDWKKGDEAVANVTVEAAA